jgi:hypothetical protein
MVVSIWTHEENVAAAMRKDYASKPMKTVLLPPNLILRLVLPCLALVSGSLCADDFVYTDDAGRIRVRPHPVPAELLNEWPQEREDAFWDRANAAIRANAKGGGYGGTYFENEKAMYPKAMFGYLGGFREPALKALQAEDADAKSWNTVTDGIDFFPCFTLKGQMRKYFLFGPQMDPAYVARMKKAAKTWTEKDPLRRPHPCFKNAKEGWTPEAKNSWVDVRNTDNLQAMRETSVYLMAEETGNEEVRRLYEERIRKYVANLYHVGMGEWDSANYHGHTLTAYLNLYDFAKDRDVKALAKAALDYFTAVGAVKYWRGSFSGPSRREYGHTTPRSGGTADHLALYFDDYPGAPESYDRDQVYLITSAYRPPKAVVRLAHKAFAKPLELFLAHPPYEALRQGAEAPEFHETRFVGHSFELGTLAEGTGFGDVNGFRLMAYSTERGAEFFIANATRDPFRIGAPQYGDSQVGRMNIAQYRNVCIVLNQPGDSPFLFQAPATAQVETEGRTVFVKLERTWLALHPLNLAWDGVDAELTRKLQEKKPGEQVLAAHGTGGQTTGFALEVGEKESHGDYAAFRKAVLKKSHVDTAAADGRVAFAGANGEAVAIRFGGARPEVWRNGQPHDFATAHRVRIAPAQGGDEPVALGWKQGTLRVKAGGESFACTVGPEGEVTFGGK